MWRGEFLLAAECRSSPRRNFDNRQTAVARQNEIPANGRPPLLVQVKFPRPAECRCSSKRNSCDRRDAVTHPRGISTNGGLPLAVQEEFRRPAECRYLSKRNLGNRRIAAAYLKGISAGGGLPCITAHKKIRLPSRRIFSSPILLQVNHALVIIRGRNVSHQLHERGGP